LAKKSKLSASAKNATCRKKKENKMKEDYGKEKSPQAKPVGIRPMQINCCKLADTN
jgi:hypothetical protein